MKKYFYVTLFFLFLFMPLFALSLIARPASPKDIQKILDRGYLLVALPQLDYPFFFEMVNGKLQGYDITIAEDIAKRLGVDIRYYREQKTFDDVVSAVAQDKADIAICNLSETLKRGKIIAYTTPYMTMNFALLVNRLWLSEQYKIYSIKNSAELFFNHQTNLSVMTGTSYVQDAERLFPKATIKKYATLNETFNAVVNGKVNASFHDELQIKRYLLENPKAALYSKIIIFTKNPDEIGIAVPYTKHALLHWLNLYLRLQKVHINTDYILQSRLQSN